MGKRSSNYAKDMNVSVIIPNYNRKLSVLSLLGDVSKQEGVDFETIVVDDCSTDDSADAIGKAFPEAKLSINPTNSGPSVSRNNGIRLSKGDIVVGFDSDVSVPDRHCLKKVVDAFAENPTASALAFRLLQSDGKTEDHARWWHPLACEEFASTEFETDYFSGTGFAFRKSAITSAGGFPEYLYMHYEEVILALNTIRRGLIIKYYPSISVIHHEGQISRRSEIKSFYKNRNQLLLAYQYYPFLKAIFYYAPRSINSFLEALRGGHLSNYFSSLKSGYKMIRDGTVRRDPIERKILRYLSGLRKQ